MARHQASLDRKGALLGRVLIDGRYDWFTAGVLDPSV
jgi:hypothetical protein